MAMHCANVSQVKVGRLADILDLTLHVQVTVKHHPKILTRLLWLNLGLTDWQFKLLRYPITSIWWSNYQKFSFAESTLQVYRFLSFKFCLRPMLHEAPMVNLYYRLQNIQSRMVHIWQILKRYLQGTSMHTFTHLFHLLHLFIHKFTLISF